MAKDRVMYQALQSSTWLQNHTADRPSFQAKVSRGYSSSEHVVFAMQHGLLFLEQKDHVFSGRNQGINGAVVAGAIMGGAAGALIAGALTSGNGGPTRKESGLETQSDEELFALARTRKKSFVAERDDIESVLIDAPSFLAGLFNSRLAGTITIRDRQLGKIRLEIFDRASMSAAIDAFPRHYGNRTTVNVRWDQGKNGYVSLGR
ncbi:MAG: hypothetical protein WEH44_04655 [Pirellulaceae bacterium]